MPEACFCYATNIHYMGATLLSAMQARRHLARSHADVVVLYLCDGDAAPALFPELCRAHGILFQPISGGDIDGLPVQFVRHFLDRLLDPAYRAVVFADGDTQIAGPLEPLFKAALPAGSVMVTPDPMAVMIHEDSRFWQSRRAYFLSIGIPERRLGRYFNSGLFRMHRADLGTVGRECVRLWRKRGTDFRYSEQDAFNIAFGAEATLISFRWNFPAFFLNGGYDQTIEPRMIHFMSNPRPWHGAFMPWGWPAHRVYRDLVDAHPQLAGSLRPMRGWKALRYAAQQRGKRLFERHTWGRPAVRARVAAFEAAAIV
jgi:hypothetical protein